MPDYNFENLDAKNFEHLANALGLEYISRGLMIYGSGTDGGREAAYKGKMLYPTVEAPWDGYLVVQCKRKETRGATPKDEATWAIEQLNAEMKKYQDAKIVREKPEYFLFVTSAELSAKPNSGGKDRFVKRLDYWVKKLGMKAADVWDRDKLSRLLDGNQKVAQRFGLLHSGDLIHYVATTILAHQQGIGATLAVFLQEELRADQFVNLAQAGHTNDDKTPLARVFVDLRAKQEETDYLQRGFYVVDSIQRESDRPLYPSLLEREQEAEEESQHVINFEEPGEDDDEEEYDEDEYGDSYPVIRDVSDDTFSPTWSDPSRFVIVGGPGQGKSTLAQHLAQRHRAALLSRYAAGRLEAGTEKILRIIKDAAIESGIGLPVQPRFPFRIVLEQFADALAKKNVASVLEYIAAVIKKRTGMPFERKDAEQLLAETPWFVAFDGLDEVPAVSNRDEVLDAVRRFLMEARAKDADVLVIATTRPQGYEAEFAPANFNHMTLTPLSRREALAYATKFVEAKYESETDRRERIMQRLETAAREEATARLMESPLQVTIMAALVDLVGNPPRERYPLFNRYYEVVYQREQERGLKLSDVLAHHRVGIEILHDRIGLLLQIEAESAGSTQSKISRERLEGLVHDYLVADGFQGKVLERTKADFMDVALHRLVFIVPVEDGRYGFEVRSLQEFSAARSLMRGEYAKVKERLFTIAPVPYWRNTTLFAVGRAFSEQDEQQSDMITHMCRELNDAESDTILFRTLAGSRLALDILEDYVVEWRPKYRRFFFQTAFELLTIPDTKMAVRLAKLYTPDDEDAYKEAILKTAGSGSKDLCLNLFVILAELAQRDDASWATEVLQRIWPVTVEDERRVLEQIAKLLDWSPWAIDAATRVARVSSIEWTSENIPESIPVKWIRDAKIITRPHHRRNQDVSFMVDGKATGLRFYYTLPFLTADILDRIARAKPTHWEWTRFIESRNFLLNPSAETLAEALEEIAKNDNYIPNQFYYNGLPWQLSIFMNLAESREELILQAERARKGELGSVAEWKKAEERWASTGFTPEDLQTFTDDVWPFTAEVANRGMPQLGLFGFSRDNEKEDGKALDVLLETFYDQNMSRSGKPLSRYALYVGGITHVSTDITLKINVLTDLVKKAVGLVRPVTLLSLIDHEFNWAKAIDELDFIGSRISAIVSYESEELLHHFDVNQGVERLVALLGKGKTMQEGILRFIAALVEKGATVQIPLIDYKSLSMQGRVALTTIQLITGTLHVATDEFIQLIESLWTFGNPNSVLNIPEIPNIIIELLDRQSPLSNYNIEVLDKLYSKPFVNIGIKRRIIESFNSQIQYRTSKLNDPGRKSELALALN
jgi:hypothetical protein